jgi:hypothetical protein
MYEIRDALHFCSFDLRYPTPAKEHSRTGKLKGVGAADKAAIQLVKVQPCQLFVAT